MDKHAELIVQKQLKMQAMILELSSSFINVKLGSLDETIHNALKCVGLLSKADRVYIFKYDFDNDLCKNTYEWCANNVTPQIDNLQSILLSKIPDWVAAHLRHEDLYIKDVLKMEDSYTKSILSPQGVKSLLTVPMVIDNKCIGFIGLDAVKEIVYYDDYERFLLRELANMIIHAESKISIERELFNSRHMLRMILDSIPVGVFWKDNDLNYLGCNKIFAKDSGLDNPDDIIGTNDFMHIWASEAPLYQKDDREVLKSLKPKYNIIEPQPKVDGSTAWVRTNKIPLIDINQNLLGVLGTSEDITENTYKDKRLANIIEATQAGTWEWNIVTGEQIINNRWAEMIGYSVEELSPVTIDTWRNLIHPDDLVMAETMLRDVFDKKADYYSLETRIKHKNGHWIWILDRGKVVTWNADGTPLMIMGTHNDVSERKNIEASLKISEERNRLLVSQMPQGLAFHEIITNENGYPIDYRFIFVNKGFETLTGLKADDIIGKTVLQALPQTESNWIKRYGQVALTGKSMQFEDYSAALDKHFNVTAYMTVSGKFAVIFYDITERVSLNKSLFYEKQRLSRVVDSTADIIFEIDTNKRFVSVFGRGLSDLEHYPEDYVGKTVLDVFGKAGFLRDKYYSLALEGTPQRYEWTFQKENKIIYFNSTISPIYDEKNNISGAVGISRDITDIKARQSEIEYMSFHDHLTGLKNRRYFAEALAEKDNETNYPLCIMMIDLNGLKIINDAYGHGAGDQALHKVADIISRLFKNDQVAARIGGDEFAVILPSTSQEEAANIKTQLIFEVSQLKIEDVFLSVSIGFETKETASIKIGEVMKTAENYMYKHKLIVGKSARSDTIKAILKTLTDKYTDEKLHSESVSKLSISIGRALGLSKDDLLELGLAGLFHDIGKISIPDAILKKSDSLTKAEYEIIKAHTENGYQILRAADEYSNLAVYALYHHERFDGTGYPQGLKGEDIPLFSRIICIADAYEAMTSDRPYRKAPGKRYAIRELTTHAGTQFDAKIVNTFLSKVLKIKD